MKMIDWTVFLLLIAAYLICSFIASALYVRIASQSKLARRFRKNIYLFLLFLPIGFARLLLSTATIPFRISRRLFELASGKPTIKRMPIDYYRYPN